MALDSAVDLTSCAKSGGDCSILLPDLRISDTSDEVLDLLSTPNHDLIQGQRAVAAHLGQQEDDN